MSLDRLIAEARVLAGGQHACDVLGHAWRDAGGRACPYGCPQSQPVFLCASCGQFDYGDPGGPGDDFCVTECLERERREQA